MKRFFDIVCSILGIIVLSPVFIIVSILIKLESKGPIIFKQLRAGKNSKPFYIYKFRSMKIETPNIATNDFTNSHVYITKIGKIIRKTSIDEIPQLFNILKGDMSIVGPRPVILEEVDLIELRQSYNIDKILPGITGWAQINGRDNIGNEEKVKYDYEYLVNKSFIMDLYIIVMTALKVLKRSDIKD
ncbi:MAG: sugar transferase [Romboutsia sp.]|nr:sugar transferase [Romboutsia sp.]